MTLVKKKWCAIYDLNKENSGKDNDNGTSIYFDT